MDREIRIEGSDWLLELPEGDEVNNFVLRRKGNQHFHVSMIDDQVVLPDGKVLEFRQPLVFEHDQGTGKAGDVVIQFRVHPHTGRYMVQVEQENAYEDATTKREIWRIVRSSVDNIAQAVKKTVAHTGWVYSNPRRIGGKPIKTHYVIAGWSPQLADKMMDVYDFVQGLDALGLATFVKALQVMPDRPAREIFRQMRMPAA